MGVIRSLVISIAVILLSTLGINAFDNLDVPSRSLLGAAFSSLAKEPCPQEMAFVSTSAGGFCIDRFEASPSDACPVKDPLSKRDTDDNMALNDCSAMSEKNAVPWRFITRQQAELACVRAGKRLPTNEEWYRAALGTPDSNGPWGKEDCNVSSLSADRPEKTGSRPLCASVSGAYDMIGNVWEWLEETAQNGVYDSEQFPEEGYIAEITSSGIPTKTDAYEASEAFFEDYFWLDATDVRGMLRGGYWKSKTDAGQYALNVTVPPSFVGDAVGFRCAKTADN